MNTNDVPLSSQRGFLVFDKKGYWKPTCVVEGEYCFLTDAAKVPGVNVDDITETSTGAKLGDEYTLTYKIEGLKTTPATITLRMLEIMEGFHWFHDFYVEQGTLKSVDDIRRDVSGWVVMWGTLKQDKTSATRKKLIEMYDFDAVKVVQKALKGSKKEVRWVRKAIGAYFFCQLLEQEQEDYGSHNLEVLDYQSFPQEWVDDLMMNWKSQRITADWGFTSKEEFLETIKPAENGGLMLAWISSEDINNKAA